MDAVLEKERQELLKSQENEEEDGPKRFGSMNCIICMDNFTNLTATACGKHSSAFFVNHVLIVSRTSFLP